VQGIPQGPALFVVDPGGLNPTPTVGDRVTFTVETMGTASDGVLRATTVSNYSRMSLANNLTPLVQDLSQTEPLDAEDYESELIRLQASVSGPFEFAGSGYQSAQVTTPHIPTPSNALRVRVPTDVVSSLDLVNTCVLTLNRVPMWRFGTTAQPSMWSKADLDLTGTSCPLPKVVGAAATSLTTVVVSFDRNIDGTTVSSNGIQFSFNGLTATSPTTASGRQVTVTTSTQTGGQAYTVTVDTSVKDNLGAGLNDAFRTASFTGYTPEGRLVINEIDYDQASTDTREFVEIFNGTFSAVDLTNLALVFINGGATGGPAEYLRVLLNTGSSTTLPAGGYLVAAMSTLINEGGVDPGAIVITSAFGGGIQNGAPDAVVLFNTSSHTVIDSIVYEGSMSLMTTIDGVSFTLSETTTLADPADDNPPTVPRKGIARCPNGQDTDNGASDLRLVATTPGSANATCP
jgi:hypothetical protein